MVEEQSGAPNVIPEGPEAEFLKELSVLPPLQKKGTLSWDELGDAIQLPAIRPEEAVQSLRSALSEFCGYAHLTSFRFVLEDSPNKKGETRTALAISPYTGPNAVVSVPVAVRSLDSVPHLLKPTNGNVVEPDDAAVVLDDYGDLTLLLDKGLKDGMSFRIVLERYDPAAVRDHITRVRYLLDGNPPSVTTLVENEAPKPSEEIPDESAQEEGAADKSTEPTLSAIPETRPVALDGTNLKDFYYLSCGEEDSLYHTASFDGESTLETYLVTLDSPKKKKNKPKQKEEDTTDEGGALLKPVDESFETTARRLNELEEQMRVRCSIRFSGFHPPPRFRRMMGDLAYLEVMTPDNAVFFVTAVPTGFYVNGSSVVNGSYSFNPSPASKPCFSHELLDCLLQASDSLCVAWKASLAAAKEKVELTASLDKENPLHSLHRVAVRSSYGGVQRVSTAAASRGLDLSIFRPSWLVPLPQDREVDNAWNHNSLHEYNPARTEDDLSSMFGLDIRNGTARDWNEELQSAREMPVSNLQERIERARLINKVLNDFGEASLIGAMAIFDGHVAPMNPNEPTRSHVFLHNNIFFSRAIDSGVETFKIASGDRCARKSASRDAQCVGALHRMDVSGLHSLATVLVDYLGTRFVCQSIVPGILHGEKTHTLLYGAVEASSPLTWDKDMHELLEQTIGRSFMIATRPVPTRPLTSERMAEIEKLKSEVPFLLEKGQDQLKDDEELPETRMFCGPIEAKGIRGSDQRKYILDLTRLTPRDANWVAKSEGGTGKWEAVLDEIRASNGNKKDLVPETLDDEEMTMALLRPEIVTILTHTKMAEYLKTKKEKGLEGEKDSEAEDDTKEGGVANDDKGSVPEDIDMEVEVKRESKDEKAKPAITLEDEEYLKSMRVNLNLFLPNVKSMIDVDPSLEKELEGDFQRVRDMSDFLWDVVLPRLTLEVREAASQVLPNDGGGITELIHQRGINCKYLGRLAFLAAEEEQNDRTAEAALKKGQTVVIHRNSMPQCWLEMLECEMVARSAKHVLDSYLTENGGAAAAQPAQTVASFLSALLSTSEETAGETETRLLKDSSVSSISFPDEDDFNALTIVDTGGDGDCVPAPIRDRKTVWHDIERDIGRRFRYTLSLYNQGGSSTRALFTPLLRRVCQKTGVRLAANNYSLGGKCLCSAGTTAGGRITASYPISALDIVEIVPLVKHSAAASSGEGFVPCALGPNIFLPSLHISLPDAKRLWESANLHYGTRSLPQALDLAQEAAALYQRVTDTPIHQSILRCLNLSSTILFAANELQLATVSASRALALAVQLGGFDSRDALECHSTLGHILVSSGELARGVKHVRAAMYLMELMAGPRYAELSTYYNKLGNHFFMAKQYNTALRCFEEAEIRPISDRLMVGSIKSSTSMVMGSLGEFKAAIEKGKETYQIYSKMLGEDHELTKRNHRALQNFTRLAVEQRDRETTESKKLKEEAAATAMAHQIEAEEEKEEKKKSKKNLKKKKHKK